MTNAVVWWVPETGEIWAAADSRVSTPSATRPNEVNSVTDQAVKIFHLPVTVRGSTRALPQEHEILGLNLGIVYAGAVTPALMTYHAAATFLANLVPPKPYRLPTLEQVANLVRHLAERYTQDAAVAYPKDKPPFCEFVVFGLDPPGGSIQEEAPQAAYWIHPKPQTKYATFAQVMDRVELEQGEIAVIGDKTEGLRDLITAVGQERNPAWKGVEPRIALDRRMAAGHVGSVGGTLQFALHRGNRVELFGWARDADRKTHQNWLGFDCAGEISSALGMPVQLRALL
jgi:hypothetical protein